MNNVIISGRLTADPELKTTPNGVSVCTFIVAVDRNSKDDIADFPIVVAWRQTAEFVAKYLSKGRKVIIRGEIRTRNYEDKDGNKRKATEIQADRVEFADSMKQQNDSQEGYDNGYAGY
jgi:single-strand DNA-binding protein